MDWFLALACDHRLGTRESCQLGLTEARAGISFPAVAMNVRAADLGVVPRTAYARIKQQLRAAVIRSNAEVLAHGDPLVDAWLSADTGAASASLLRGE